MPKKNISYKNSSGYIKEVLAVENLGLKKLKKNKNKLKAAIKHYIAQARVSGSAW